MLTAATIAVVAATFESPRTNITTTKLRTRRHGTNGRHLIVGTYKVYAGDEIATRHNDRRLTTDRGEMVRNRAMWTVGHIHPPSRSPPPANTARSGYQRQT